MPQIKIFNTVELKGILQTNNMNAQMVCEVCGIFVEISKYEMHKKFGHKKTKEDHKCNICDKTFKSKLVNIL